MQARYVRRNYTLCESYQLVIVRTSNFQTTTFSYQLFLQER